jgi:hypothetical protein
LFQVQNSASQSRDKLGAHFDQLKQCVCEALDERLRALLKQVQDVEGSAMGPLQQCDNLLSEKVKLASAVLDEGFRFTFFVASLDYTVYNLLLLFALLVIHNIQISHAYESGFDALWVSVT